MTECPKWVKFEYGDVDPGSVTGILRAQARAKRDGVANVPCGSCNACCRSPHLYAELEPDEMARFEHVVHDEFGPALPKREDGSCVHLTEPVALATDGYVGVFRQHQPAYARHGIATVPVEFVPTPDGKPRKKPCVTAPKRIGLRASENLRRRFTHIDGIGFIAGAKSNITVLDVDTRDGAALLTAIEMWGEPGMIVETTGGYHLYYRHSGEPGEVRFLGQDKPYDLLGAGLVVGAPSESTLGLRYRLLEGTLDNLGKLPAMRQVAIPTRACARQAWNQMREGDGRNRAMFGFLMLNAHGRSLEQIEKMADNQNAELKEPLDDGELATIIGSVWRYEDAGKNFTGRGKSMVLGHDIYDKLESDWDAMRLFMRLKRVHWHRRRFILAGAMGAEFGWGWSRFKAATVALVRLRIIACLHEGGRGPKDPPIYTWVK